VGLKKNSKRKYFRYGEGAAYMIPRMRFIHNGDGYAFTNEYYRGGVRW